MTAIDSLKQKATRTCIVDCHHHAASDTGPGDEQTPFATIARAAAQAGPGDVIRICPGTYRERVSPARGGTPEAPILYIGDPRGRTIIRGSERWTPTHLSNNGVASGPLPPLCDRQSPPWDIASARACVAPTLGQVFVDGREFAEVEDAEALESMSGLWWIDRERRRLHVRLPDHLDARQVDIELTVRSRLFAPHRRGLGHIHLRHLVFEHCGNQFPDGFWKSREHNGHPQAGAVGTRSGHHWRVEHCTIRHAAGIGLDCGSEGEFDLEGDQPAPPVEQVGFHHIVNNDISDNGACGIAGQGQTGTVIAHNRVERNNTRGFAAPEAAGIKVHFFFRGRIEANLVEDNDAHGIWLDNRWDHSRVTRNICLNNKGSGIFIEMGVGPCLVDHNVCAHTRQGEGIYLHDSSLVTVVHNLLHANSHFGLYARIVTDRNVETLEDKQPVACEDLTIRGNMFIDNHRGHLALPADGPRCERNRSDHNLFISGQQWQWEAPGFSPFTLTGFDGRRGDNHRPNTGEALQHEPWQQRTGHDRASQHVIVCEHEVINGAVARGGLLLAPHGSTIQAACAGPLPLVELPVQPDCHRDLHGKPRDRTTSAGPWSLAPDIPPPPRLWPLVNITTT